MITFAELTGLNHRSLVPDTRATSPGTPPASPAASPAPDPEPVRSPSHVHVPCRKRAYPDWIQAEAQRVLLLSMPNCKSPGTLITYVCHNCQSWHVGHDTYEKISVPDQGHPRNRRVK